MSAYRHENVLCILAMAAARRIDAEKAHGGNFPVTKSSSEEQAHLMFLTLGLTGMDQATEIALKTAFAEASERIGHWRMAAETEADFVVVDMDSMYGPMSWLRLHAAGKQVIGMTAAPRTQADFRLPRPFDAYQLGLLMTEIARGRGLLPEPEAPAPAPPAQPAPAPAPAVDYDALQAQLMAEAAAFAASTAEPSPSPALAEDWMFPSAETAGAPANRNPAAEYAAAAIGSEFVSSEPPPPLVSGYDPAQFEPAPERAQEAAPTPIPDPIPAPVAQPAPVVEPAPAPAPAPVVAVEAPEPPAAVPPAPAQPAPEASVTAEGPEASDTADDEAPATSTPRATLMAHWLRPGALTGRARYQSGNGPALWLDFGQRQYFGPTALKPLSEYFVVPVGLRDFEDTDERAWHTETAKLGAPQPMSRLQWFGGLLAAEGRLLPGYDPEGRYLLNKWPQTEREFPRHFRIATAMMKGPSTLTEIAAASGVPEADIADFINANLATGFAEAVSDTPPADPTRPAKPGGLLDRLRGR